MHRMSILKERVSSRMFSLYGRLCLAVAFQKLRENRKQVQQNKITLFDGLQDKHLCLLLYLKSFCPLGRTTHTC